MITEVRLIAHIGAINGDRFAKAETRLARANHLCIFRSVHPHDMFTFIRSGEQFGGKCFARIIEWSNHTRALGE
jgi:hypothetical protein